MAPSVTVLVVGAGRFGRNYLSVIETIAASHSPDLPRFGTLLLSRTDLEAAGETAHALSALPNSPFDQVLGVAIASEQQLKAVLGQYRPDLICIVARDGEVGDDIHADYALAGLESGAVVLCEKPFHRPGPDGRGMTLARALAKHPMANRFGMELPMAVVRNAMWAEERLHNILKTARTIEILWEKQDGSEDLLSDLALHPWSLLPPTWHVEVRRSVMRKQRVTLALDMIDPLDSSIRTCTIDLACGGTFRGMRMADHQFQFLFDQGRLQVWESPVRKGPLGTADLRGEGADLVLSIPNPLQQHIEAALRGRPLVDNHQTMQSQKFLEAAAKSARIEGGIS